MGFFSKRSEESSTARDDASIVRSIRSKWPGRSKGKEREAPPSAYGNPAAAASVASFSSHTTDKRGAAPSLRARPSVSSRPMPTAPTPPRRAGNVSDMHPRRPSSDVITVTLAQRLNELATANSEGLLSDDEYRLLRQNLFERFASGSAVPTEEPLVRMSGPSQSNGDSRNSMSHLRRPSSNFHIQATLRTPSIQSKKSFTSITSSVTGLFRRATNKRVMSMPSDVNGSDAMSIYSVVSTPGERATFPRQLSKQMSDTSLGTSVSRKSSTHNRRTVVGNHTFSATDPGPRPNRTRTRSGSTAPPPSSFPRSNTMEASYTHLTSSDIPTDDQVESVQDIRHQLELVEAEGRRLLDAFNGLELSTLTRKQRKPPVIPPLPTHSALSEGWSHISSSGRSLRGKDSDTISFKSAASGRTTTSMKRTPSKMRAVQSASTLGAQLPIMRKTSMSSVSSRGRTAQLALHTNLASSSSVNLARSNGHLPLATVQETEGRPPLPSTRDSSWSGASPTVSDSHALSPLTPNGSKTSHVEDEELDMLESELADIRRRRVEVTARYESRLEYLRARLKGAELREKLLRK